MAFIGSKFFTGEKNLLTTVKVLTVFLLLVNAMGALFGGYHLMTDPSGSSLYLNSHYLQNTTFTDYFFPGLILFVCNGISSLVVMLGLLAKWRTGPLLLMAQGFILLSWIVIQVILIDTVYFLHYIMGITGIVLILCGVILEKNRT